jgi:hypothetical protein
VGGTSLSTPQLASHAHAGAPQQPGPGVNPGNASNFPVLRQGYNQNSPNPQGGSPGINPNLNIPQGVGNTGGGGTHAHPFSGSLSGATANVSVTVPAADVKYANVIVAAKD